MNHSLWWLLLVCFLVKVMAAGDTPLELDSFGRTKDRLIVFDGDAAMWGFWVRNLKRFMTGMGLVAFLSLGGCRLLLGRGGPNQAICQPPPGSNKKGRRGGGPPPPGRNAEGAGGAGPPPL